MPPDRIIRIAIADDHPVIRTGIKRLVTSMPDIEIVGEASDGQQAIELIETVKPDILILDLQMLVMNGIQVIDHLMLEQRKVIILF